MAYPLSLLALINGPTTAAAWQPRSAWPASRSLSAGPAPRYGTCVTVAPISWANSMPHRCANEPTPACAILAFCPGSFSQRTSSAMVLGGSIGLPTTVVAAALTGSDRDEILFSVEPGLRIQRHGYCHCRIVQQHRVAVGRGAGGAGGADRAAGAADVLDDDLLAERFRHAVLHDARDRIGRAAGRKRRHQRNRMARIGLRRARLSCQDRRSEDQRRERAREHHDSSQCVSLEPSL